MTRLFKFLFWGFGAVILVTALFTPVVRDAAEHAIDYFMENYADDFEGNYDDSGYDDGGYAYDDYDTDYDY